MKPAPLLVVLLAAGMVGAVVYVQVQKHGRAERPGDARPSAPNAEAGSGAVVPGAGPAPPQEEVHAQIARLRGDDDNRAFQAAERLGVLRDPRAIPPLITALRTHRDFYVRMGCATALGALGAWTATGALVDALGEADPLVREASADALHAITGHAIAGVDAATASARERREWQQAWRTWLAENGRGGN